MPEVRQEVFVVDVMKVTQMQKWGFSLFTIEFCSCVLDGWLVDIFVTRAKWFSSSYRERSSMATEF